MQSGAFGKPGWDYMFYCAAGYDLNKTPKKIKDPQYKTFFEAIGYTIPCIFCRQSYEKFFASLDIQRYMDMPSCGLIRFVYDLKNLVNDKLKVQERKALQEEFQKLAKTISPSDENFWKEMRDKCHKICYTKPAPPFQEVVDNLMKHRAGCSEKMKSCRDPLKVDPTFPKIPDISTFNLDREGPSDREIYKLGGKGHVSRYKSRRKSIRNVNRAKK